MHYTYKTQGTCSKAIELDLDENQIVKNVKFIGGCSGNTQGVAVLVEGKKADDIVDMLKGIKCGWKSTSCPDQLALAILEAKTKL